MLIKFLSENRERVVNRWFELTTDAYPADTAKFYQRETDRFANPVGSTIRSETARLYDALISGADLDDMRGPLDGIIRIRAVQELSPSSALGFMFLLKKAIREELEKAKAGPEFFEGLLEFEGGIDRAALLAFEIYMECREQVFRIRSNELRARSARLIDRLNLADENHEQECDL